mgnify:CR=1 FL=1
MPPLDDIPAFVAVRLFADRMLAVGRGDFGSGPTPLFAGQLNTEMWYGDVLDYAARLGSADLASAILGFALSVAGRNDIAPPLRNPYGAMPW